MLQHNKYLGVYPWQEQVHHFSVNYLQLHTWVSNYSTDSSRESSELYWYCCFKKTFCFRSTDAQWVEGYLWSKITQSIVSVLSLAARTCSHGLPYSNYFVRATPKLDGFIFLFLDFCGTAVWVLGQCPRELQLKTFGKNIVFLENIQTLLYTDIHFTKCKTEKKIQKKVLGIAGNISTFGCT